MQHRRKDEEQKPGDDQPADHVVPRLSGSGRQGTVSVRLPRPIHARPEELGRWDLPLGKASNLPSSCHGHQPGLSVPRSPWIETFQIELGKLSTE